jgi:hypothetical protein
MRFRAAVIAGALVASSFAASDAGAQVAVSGTTRGCFGVGCTGTSTALFQGLTFNGGTFFGTTDSHGFLGIGGNGNNFGLLTLLPTPNFDYGAGSGTSFTLFFDFTQPGVSTGSPLFTAAILGNIVQVGNGVSFRFSPNTGSTPFATVTISSPVGVNAGDPAQQISGEITAVPEPASLVLLATGLFGVVGFVARRRNRLNAA